MGDVERIAKGLTEAQRRCGNCRLWGANFYPRYRGWPVNTTCAADAVMDLPASFIPNRQTMNAGDGEGCICWQPVRAHIQEQSNDQG